MLLLLCSDNQVRVISDTSNRIHRHIHAHSLGLCLIQFAAAAAAAAGALLLLCSEDQVRVMSDISNSELRDALQQPRPEWSKVRWVNVQVRGY
jgi:predicted ATP-grasp superfamily ATP-dependent carboligase